jgi:hypothetical protein
MMVQRSSWTLSGSTPCYAQRRWQGRGGLCHARWRRVMAYFESLCLKGTVWTHLKASRSHRVCLQKFLPHLTPFRLLA